MRLDALATSGKTTSSSSSSFPEGRRKEYGKEEEKLSDRPALHHQQHQGGVQGSVELRGDLGGVLDCMAPAAAKALNGVPGAACRNMGTPCGVNSGTHPTSNAVIGTLCTRVMAAFSRAASGSASMSPVSTTSPSCRMPTKPPWLFRMHTRLAAERNNPLWPGLTIAGSPTWGLGCCGAAAAGARVGLAFGAATPNPPSATCAQLRAATR